MALVSEGSSLKSLLRSILVVEHVLGFLLLTHSCEGQSQEVVPSSAVTATIGDDAVLPCHLKTPTDAGQLTLEWGRPDLKPRFVYVWYNRQEYLPYQNSAFKGRASLSMDKMKQGDVSLKLSNLRFSDNGRYRCFISEESREYFIDLIVGVASSPGTSLAGLDESSSRVVLQCESAGWYPEPELFWLDHEEQLLSAAPAETARGPDGLFTVSSRVTVEKRHNNSFMCRVQQKDINQTRETHIHVPDDFFIVSSDCTASVGFNVLFCILLVVAAAVFIWKWRQRKTLKKEAADTAEEKRLLVEEIKKANMSERKMKREQDVKSLEQVIDALKEIKEELEKQDEKLTEQRQRAQKEAEENDEKIRATDEEVRKTKGDKTAIKAKAYLKLKEIVDESVYQLEERKKEQQEFQMKTQKLVKKANDEIKRMIELKQETERHVDNIRQHKEETETTSEKDTKQDI